MTMEQARSSLEAHARHGSPPLAGRSPVARGRLLRALWRRPRWRSVLGRYWHLISLALALLVLMASFAIGFALLARALLEHTKEQQNALAEETRTVMADAADLLRILQRWRTPTCDDATLTELRRLQFGARHVRDIGLLNERSEVFCSTGLGRWTSPLPVSRPTLYIGDLAIWLRVPIRLSDASVRAMVQQLGAFNVVMDHNVTESINARNPGIGWITSGAPYASWVGPQVRAQDVGDMSDTLLRYRSGLAWSVSDCRVDVLTSVIGAPYSFHQRLRCVDALRYSPVEAAAFAALSLALALMAFAMLAPRLEALRSPLARLGELCSPEHVQCLYQPIVDLQSGKLVGCEVLMRLRDGAETLAPDTVLPSIIAQGLSWQLDQAVSTRSMQELGSLGLAPGFRVALNFVPKDLRFAVLHPHLQALRERHRMEHVALSLEIVEHSIDAQIMAEIPQFRASGYVLSVDDFGTGFSNLKSVKAIRPDLLKIDKSFVFDMEADSLRSSLIPQMIDIARAVNAKVVAEGIENVEQLLMLRHLGVQFGQGYYLGRPMPLQAFGKLVASRAALAVFEVPLAQADAAAGDGPSATQVGSAQAA